MPLSTRLRPWLFGALLWLGLMLLVSAPRWLHCAIGSADLGCRHEAGWELLNIGATLGVMMLAVVGGARLLPAAPGRRGIGLLLLVLAVMGLSLMTSAGVVYWRKGSAIGPPSLYTLQVLLTQSACMVVAWVYMQEARAHQRDAAELHLGRLHLEQQLDAARLQLLQAQVEPHFLFNTLAHLRRLAQTDPQAARAMLADLLAYLGEALPELREAESTLERELRLVRAYLALHQRRMGETRLRFGFEIEPGLEQARLPATALLTLAENAIKHGIAPLVTGGTVQLRARREGEQLLLEVADTGRGMGEASGHGTGLATLRARLKALYGEAGQLQLRVNQPRGLVVSLQLPLQFAS